MYCWSYSIACIVNEIDVPRENSALCKTHKPNIPVCSLTTGCNTAIGNLPRFMEVLHASLTNNIATRMRDRSYLLDIIDEID